MIRNHSTHNQNIAAQELLTKSSTGKSGFVRRKEGTKFTKWNQRYIILTRNRLYVYDSETSKAPNDFFALLGYKGVCRYTSKSRTAPWAFCLVPAYKDMRWWKFSCASDSERFEWMRAMKTAMYVANGLRRPSSTAGDEEKFLGNTNAEKAYEKIEDLVFDGDDNSVDEHALDDYGSENPFPDVRKKSGIRDSDCSHSSGSSGIRSSDASCSSSASGTRVSDVSVSSVTSGTGSSSDTASSCHTISDVSISEDHTKREGAQQPKRELNASTHDSLEPHGDEPVYNEPDTGMSSEGIYCTPIDHEEMDEEPEYVNLRSLKTIHVHKPSFEELCSVKNSDLSVEELNVMLKERKPGTYLLRKSRAGVGEVISYLNLNQKVHEFKVHKDEDGKLSLDKTQKFSNTEELLKAYSSRLKLPNIERFLEYGFHDKSAS